MELTWTGAYLEMANLEGAYLLSANLIGVSLEFTLLQKANLLGANLHRVNLRGANLKEANLNGANFQGPNLWNTDLTGASLDDAQFDEKTVLPNETMNKTDDGMNTYVSDSLLPARRDGYAQVHRSRSSRLLAAGLGEGAAGSRALMQGKVKGAERVPGIENTWLVWSGSPLRRTHTDCIMPTLESASADFPRKRSRRL